MLTRMNRLQTLAARLSTPSAEDMAEMELTLLAPRRATAVSASRPAMASQRPVRRRPPRTMLATEKDAKERIVRVAKVVRNFFFLQVIFHLRIGGVTGTGTVLGKGFHMSFAFNDALGSAPAVTKGLADRFIVLLNAPRDLIILVRLAALEAGAAPRGTCAVALLLDLLSPRGPVSATWPRWRTAASQRSKRMRMTPRTMPSVIPNAVVPSALHTTRR
jgi:hypothetical protein